MLLILNFHSNLLVMEILKVVMFAAVIIGLLILGLATQIILRKEGKFPNILSVFNKYMKDRGGIWIQTFDKMEQAKARKGSRFNELILGK